MPAKLINILGKTFGHLVVVEKSKKYGHWICQCDCGRKALIASGALRLGRTRSCGCRHWEKSFTLRHGHAREGKKSPEYRAWRSMIDRCTRPKRKDWKDYGGRGIKICRRWRKFENFLFDVGHKPSASMSLDRFPDSNGNYKPGNVRWATHSQQMKNRRKQNG
jgi:hypothetical protein